MPHLSAPETKYLSALSSVIVADVNARVSGTVRKGSISEFVKWPINILPIEFDLGAIVVWSLFEKAPAGCSKLSYFANARSHGISHIDIAISVINGKNNRKGSPFYALYQIRIC